MTLSTICKEDLDARFAEIIAAEWPKLTGRQTPDALLYTPGDPDLGRRAAEMGRRSASRIRALPWQSWALDRIMARNADGTWTHPECCLIVPRQSGKSTTLILRVLYGLFKLGENIVFSAHQWVTAKALWKRCWAIVKSTPWMFKRVVSHTCSQGRGTIELQSGAQVVFSTRSAHLARGLDCIDLEIYDEAYDLTEADMAALSPTKANARDPQTIYTSSAVNQDQHTNGHVLASVRRRGRDGVEIGLFFAEWMAPDGADRASVKTWALSNPSYGQIATEKFLTAEFRKFATAAGRKSFDCEYLGRGDWPADGDEIEPAVSEEVWDAMAEHGGKTNVQVRGAICISLDMNADRTLAGIGAATFTTNERIRIEIGYHGSPARVLAVIVDLVDRWDPCALVINGSSPAAAFAPDLRKLGIEPELTSSQQSAQAAGGFVDDSLAGRLSHADDDRVNTAVGTAEKRPMAGGAFGWEFTTAGAVIMQCVSLSRWGLLQFGEDPRPAQTPMLDEEPGSVIEDDELMTIGF